MSKREIVLKKKNNTILIVIVAVISLVLAVLFVPKKESNEKIKDILPLPVVTESRYLEPHTESGNITISLSTIGDEVQYYDYKGVKFFVLKSNDGTVRAAFDACDVCYRAKLGYDQLGDYMVCNNCGQQFHEEQINVVRGGCNPSPLKREVVDQKLVISIDDVLEGSRFF